MLVFMFMQVYRQDNVFHSSSSQYGRETACPVFVATLILILGIREKLGIGLYPHLHLPFQPPTIFRLLLNSALNKMWVVKSATF